MNAIQRTGLGRGVTHEPIAPIYLALSIANVQLVSTSLHIFLINASVMAVV